MAWTIPKVWVPAEKVTAADMNAQVSGNAQYLKDYKMGSVVTQSNPTRATGATYTNSTCQLRHVMITFLNTDSLQIAVTIIGLPEAPNYLVSRSGTDAIYMPLSFMVPLGRSYKVEIASGTGSVYKWVETEIGVL